jgi:hypothetical protein
MKKLFTTTLIIAFVFTVSNLNAQPFGGGDGLSEATAYEIYTRQHLEELADSVNFGYNWSKGMFFILMNNIEDSVRTVIGRGPTPFRAEETICLLRRSTQKTTWNRIKETYRKEYKDLSLAQSFQGYFNGGGYQIVLAINIPTEDNVGLFGCVSGNGLILDLDVAGYVIGRSRVGGLVGYVRKGLNTQSFYSFIQCISYATVTSTDGKNTEAGAIIGVAAGGKKNTIFIDRCQNSGWINNRELFPDTICSLVGSFSYGIVVKFRSIYE